MLSWDFTQENTEMAIKNMKIWITPLTIREKQIKVIIRYDYTQI